MNLSYGYTSSAWETEMEDTDYVLVIQIHLEHQIIKVIGKTQLIGMISNHKYFVAMEQSEVSISKSKRS